MLCHKMAGPDFNQIMGELEDEDEQDVADAPDAAARVARALACRPAYVGEPGPHARRKVVSQRVDGAP